MQTLSKATLEAAAEYGLANVVRDKAFEALQLASKGGLPGITLDRLKAAHEEAAHHAMVKRRAYLAAVEADPAV